MSRPSDKQQASGSSDRGRRLWPAPAVIGGLIFLWLVAAMLAALLAAASAIGVYEAILAAELAAAGVLGVTWLVWRRGGALSREDRVRMRRHRERRGF